MAVSAVQVVAPAIASVSVEPKTCQVFGCNGKTKDFFACENANCEITQCSGCIKTLIASRKKPYCKGCKTVFTIPYIGQSISAKTAGQAFLLESESEMVQMRLRIMSALEALSSDEKPVWAFEMQTKAAVRVSQLRKQRKEIIRSADSLFIREKVSKPHKDGKTSVTRTLLKAKDAVSIPIDRIQEFFALVKAHEDIQAELRYNETILKYWSSQKVGNEINESAKYVSWCKAEGCHGALNDEGECCLCGTSHCDSCMYIHDDDDEECDPDHIALYESHTTMPCASCGHVIHSLGDATFCPSCGHVNTNIHKLTSMYWYNEVWTDLGFADSVPTEEALTKKMVLDELKPSETDDVYQTIVKHLASDFLKWADDLESYVSPKDLIDRKKDLTFYTEKTIKSYKLRCRASLLLEEFYVDIVGLITDLNEETIDWNDFLRDLNERASKIAPRANSYGGLFKWSFMGKIEGMSDGMGGTITTAEGQKIKERQAKLEAAKAERNARQALIDQIEDDAALQLLEDDQEDEVSTANAVETDTLGFEESPDISASTPTTPTKRRIVRPPRPTATQ